MSEAHEQNLPVGRNLKIGLFHLGSGMADVITTGIWNRIMISDLGFSATPVGLLVSLRYFLAPLGIWAGRVSDRRTVAGYRRLFWVWLGRAMMVASTLTLGITTADLARGAQATALVWLALAGSLVLFSLGSAISGSTFLALIYDRAPEHQRGRAVGIVWTFLLIGFAVGGYFFGTMLPTKDAAHPEGFTPDILQSVFLIGALVMGALWFFSVLGEERQNAAFKATEGKDEYTTTAIADLRLAMSQPAMRYFFWFLALSMVFAFSQDLILEPFGGQVFGMEARITTRFTSYWASMAILSTIIFLFLGRRYKRLTNTLMSYIGVGLLILTFAIFALSAFAEIRPLVTIGLVTLGVGLGIWNVGTLGLMMDMSPLGRAGTFLGFWTLVVTLSRGLGVAGGGILRDLGLSLTGSLPAAYGLAFLIGGVGLGVSYWALTRARIDAYKAEQALSPDPETVFVGAMD